ncbi:hypothetical protein [Gordonia sp. NPDC003376]
MNANDIATKLNSYAGDNIWQDVIYGLDTDDAAIEAADPGAASNVVILTDGSEIRHDGNEWFVAREGRVITWQHDGERDRATLSIDGEDVDAALIPAAEDIDPYNVAEDALLAANGLTREQVTVASVL